MILYLTKKECLEIINCLDFYSRIYIGQYDQIESDYRIYLYNKNYSIHNENEIQELWTNYKKEYSYAKDIIIC